MQKTENSRLGLDFRKFTVLGVSLFILGLNMTSVNILLPEFQKIFNASLTSITLLVSLYIGAGATVQILFGRIADLWNGWKVFLLGLFVFIAGTLFCVISQSLNILIVSRCIQGVGAAMMAATFGAVIIADGKAEKTGTLFCTLQLIMLTGGIFGPLITGFLLKWLTWEWIFGINIPIGVITLLFAFSIKSSQKEVTAVKKERSINFIRHINFSGNLLWATIIAMFLTGCYLGQNYGWTTYQSIGSFTLLIFCIVIFIIADRRANYPLFPREMFKDRVLSFLLVSKIILCALQAVLLYIIPFYLIAIRNYSTGRAGLYIGILAIVSIPVVFITGQLVDRMGFRKILIPASLLPGIIILPGIFFNEGSSLILYLIWASSVAMSIAFMLVLCSIIILKMAPKGNEGIYSAINIVTFPIGMTIGLSIAAIIAQSGASQEIVSMKGVVNVTVFMEIIGLILIPLIFYLPDSCEIRK